MLSIIIAFGKGKEYLKDCFDSRKKLTKQYQLEAVLQEMKVLSLWMNLLNRFVRKSEQKKSVKLK